MSFQDLFSTIAGQESATTDTLTAAQEKLVGKTAADIAEDVIEKEIAIFEKDVAVDTAKLESHSSKLEILEGKLDDLEESIDGMEKMRSGAEAFNPELFAFHYNKAAKIGNMMGLTLERQGAESFSSKETADFNSLKGVEALSDIAKKGAEEAKKILIQIWNAFISGIGNFVSVFTGIKGKAQNALKNLSEDKLSAGAVKSPSDAYLFHSNGSNDFYKKLVGATVSFNKYIADESSYNTIVRHLEGNFGDLAQIKINKESGTLTVEKVKDPHERKNALGLSGVKSLLEDVIKGVDEVLKAQGDVKSLQTKRDKQIAQMIGGNKNSEFADQKKYSRLSSKLVLQAMNVQMRILKAQLNLAKANFK